MHASYYIWGAHRCETAQRSLHTVRHVINLLTRLIKRAGCPPGSDYNSPNSVPIRPTVIKLSCNFSADGIKTKPWWKQCCFFSLHDGQMFQNMLFGRRCISVRLNPSAVHFFFKRKHGLLSAHPTSPAAATLLLPIFTPLIMHESQIGRIRLRRSFRTGFGFADVYSSHYSS